MPKYLAANDPSRLLVDDPSGPPEKKKTHRPPKSHQPPTTARKPRPTTQYSRMVEDLTQQFLEEGEKHFGRPLPLKFEYLAESLSERINNYPPVRSLWKQGRSQGEVRAYVNRVVAHMITKFWAEMGPEVQCSVALSPLFRLTEWDYRWEKAEQWVKFEDFLAGRKIEDIPTISPWPETLPTAEEAKENRDRLKRQRAEMILAQQKLVPIEPVRRVTPEDRERMRSWRNAPRKRSRDSVANPNENP